MVHLIHEKVLAGRSVWALVVPRYHEYFFIFVDKSKGAQHDQLLTLFRKMLKTMNIENPESEKIIIQHCNEEKDAGAIINKKLIQLEDQLKQKFMILLRSDSIYNIQ